MNLVNVYVNQYRTETFKDVTATSLREGAFIVAYKEDGKNIEKGFSLANIESFEVIIDDNIKDENSVGDIVD